MAMRDLEYYLAEHEPMDLATIRYAIPEMKGLSTGSDRRTFEEMVAGSTVIFEKMLEDLLAGLERRLPPPPDEPEWSGWTGAEFWFHAATADLEGISMVHARPRPTVTGQEPYAVLTHHNTKTWWALRDHLETLAPGQRQQLVCQVEDLLELFWDLRELTLEIARERSGMDRLAAVLTGHIFAAAS